MTVRGLVPGTQRTHIFACKLFAGSQNGSPEVAPADNICDFKRYLIDIGRSAQYRSRVITGVKVLLKVVLR
jgi:hypothetical protein